MALESKILRLERKAAEVLSLKRDARPKRPFIIEFCGSPKSGKTQAATSLTIFLKRNGFNVRVLTERASVSPVSDKRNPFFNIWTGASVLTGLIPYLSEPVTDVDVVIADRGIFDTLCWFTWLEQNGALPEDEASDLENFFSTKRFRQATDLILTFTASPEISLEREYANLLTRKRGSIMAPGVLESYLESIESTIKAHGPTFKKLEKVDTSHENQNSVAVKVTTSVLHAMAEELIEKVGTISRFALEAVKTSNPDFGLQDLEEASVEIEFVSRDEAEADNTRVQLVPVVVICDDAHSRVMAFKKRRETVRRSGNSESPENEKNLLYVGGHMRSEDSFGLSSLTFSELAKATILREVSEELGTSLWISNNQQFVIWDDEGQEASQRHMAIVFVAEVRFDELKLRLDGYELVQPHNSDVSGKVFEVTDVVKWPARNLESWSRQIISTVFGEPYALRSELMDFENYVISE